MTIDASGSVFTTGYFGSTADFDPGSGVYTLTAAGTTDIYVHKLDSEGNFTWAKAIGNTTYDIAYHILADNAGKLFITGLFYGTVDFDPGAGDRSFTSAGNADFFVLCLDTAGHYVWNQPMGGPTNDESFAMALNAAGGIFLTGRFSGTVDFDPGPATYNLTSAGSYDIFTYAMTPLMVSADKKITEELFALYPNPSNGKFVLESISPGTSRIDVCIYNTAGKCIYKRELSNFKEIDISFCPAGIYFARLISGETISYHKVVIR